MRSSVVVCLPLLAALALLPACAPAVLPSREVDPAEIPALEAALARDSADAVARLALALAYQGAKRPGDARRTLERGVEMRPRDGTLVLHLGLVLEEMEAFAEARERYSAYLALEKASPVRSKVRARLPLLERRALAAAVRAAIAQEDSLARAGITKETPPEANTIAVFPFRYTGRDSTYTPLGRAMAELLSTDLAQTPRLRVLERSRIQLLVDELRRGRTERFDSTTVARTGRILRAGQVVQGQIEGDEARLRLLAAVQSTVAGGNVRAPVSEQDPAERLIDMEKRLALSLFRSMGVQLTPAEEERIVRRPTTRLQALLEYGRGLEAEDRGDSPRRTSSAPAPSTPASRRPPPAPRERRIWSARSRHRPRRSAGRRSAPSSSRRGWTPCTPPSPTRARATPPRRGRGRKGCR
jgi:TolB-like protein